MRSTEIPFAVDRCGVLLDHGVLADGASAVLWVRGQRIAAIGPRARAEARKARAPRIDLGGRVVVPGFVDLHTHGAAGVDFVEANAEEFEGAMDHYLAHGVTSLLVSIYPRAWKKTLADVARIAGFIENGRGRGVAIGIHLEGPFLSPERPGALPRRSFRRGSTADARALLEAGRGLVRTVTLAPERPGVTSLIPYFAKRGVVPCFGHSGAGYDGARASIAKGVRCATHLFNAMTGVHHRDPGAVTALLEDDRVSVEVISDGHHIAVPVLRLIHRTKPVDRVVLVSDSVHPCGLRDGAYSFAGADVFLSRGRIAQRDGTLAGSVLTLDRAIDIQVRDVGAPLAEAVMGASTNPARLIGLDARRAGTIARGARADLAILGRRHRVDATMHAGRLAWWRRGGIELPR